MAKLKPGGLALVISCPWGRNVGKTVKLIKYLGDSRSDFTDETGPAWEVYCDTGLITGTGVYKVCGAFSKRLMPIDGDDFQHEDERQKELTHG